MNNQSFAKTKAAHRNRENIKAEPRIQKRERVTQKMDKAHHGK